MNVKVVENSYCYSCLGGLYFPKKLHVPYAHLDLDIQNNKLTALFLLCFWKSDCLDDIIGKLLHAAFNVNDCMFIVSLH